MKALFIPNEDPSAAIAQRIGKTVATICVNQSFMGMIAPAKITCGMMMIGSRLLAGSSLGAEAETASPSITPATATSASVIYISSKGGRRGPLRVLITLAVLVEVGGGGWCLAVRPLLHNIAGGTFYH